MIELIIFSFFAGVLTILAPCILPVIPIIVGGSSLRAREETKAASARRPFVIILSLVISIAIFTLLLRSTTALLGVPTAVWSIVSGVIIILFGINALFPVLWEKVMLATRFNLIANRNMGKAQKNTGLKKDILLGAALGPVFNSCSPTYALIVAILLPASFALGTVYLLAYCIGLGAILLIISVFGQAVVNKIRWMSNPHGGFQKTIGVLFLVVGSMIIFGIDRQIQAAVLENGWYKPIESLERSFTGNSR